jgi:hypothetical protein
MKSTGPRISSGLCAATLTFAEFARTSFQAAWVLRRFRRFNREVITRCLAKVFACLRRQKEAERLFSVRPGPRLAEQAVSAEAQERVETAILYDIDE